MFEITANYIKAELLKIASLLKNADQFALIGPKTKAFLLGFEDQFKEDGFKWKEDLSDGGSLDKEEGVIELEGTFKDKPLELKLDKRNKKIVYTLVYDEKTHKVTNTRKLEKILRDISNEETPVTDLYEPAKEIINRYRSNIQNHIINTYLKTEKGVSMTDWIMRVEKIGSDDRFKIKFLTRLTEKQNKDEVQERFNKKYVNGQHTILENIKKHIKSRLEDGGMEKDDVDKLDFIVGIPKDEEYAGILLTLSEFNEKPEKPKEEAI